MSTSYSNSRIKGLLNSLGNLARKNAGLLLAVDIFKKDNKELKKENKELKEQLQALKSENDKLNAEKETDQTAHADARYLARRKERKERNDANADISARMTENAALTETLKAISTKALDAIKDDDDELLE